jgi:FKBP-type peptidyl-prolyl cis-trans isomerase FklB
MICRTPISVSTVAAAFLLSLSLPAFAGDISPQANQEYLDANAKKPGVIVRPSGLQYRVIKSGNGKTPGPNDTVTVAYKGSLVDGYVFDQTKPGQTHDLPVARLIAGWQEALSLMKEGDEWELAIPAALGYGAQGAGTVPSNQTLIFDMQLIAVKSNP